MEPSRMDTYLVLMERLFATHEKMNCQESESKLQDIRNLQKDLKTASSTIASSIAHEDVAIFIGSTKSGKSTLINYLKGNQLRGVKDEKLRKVYIRKADHPHEDGPQIGRGPTSETVIPTRWPSPGKLPGLALWDSPGFEDNRSSSQDIINAYYVYQLFKNIRTAKVVLVTDFNDIYNDCINSFLSLLTSVENLFKGKFRHCFSSIVVIFTKVPNVIDDEPVNVDFVTDLVEHKILSETTMEISQSALEFVRYLVKNDEQIGLFRSASVGPITSNIDAGVVQAIRTAKSIGCRILNGVSPSVSVKSKNFLHESRLDLLSSGPLEELGGHVSEILNYRLNAFQTEIDSIKLIHYSRRLRKLSCIEDQLLCLNKCIKKLSNTDTSFLKIIKVLREINLDLDTDDLIERKNMMEFIDSLLDLENTHLIMHNFRRNMETVRSNASEIMLNLQMAKNEVERRQIERELEKREEIERERRRKERELRKEREEKEEEERERRKKESEEARIRAIFVPGCFDPPLSSNGLHSLFKKFF